MKTPRMAWGARFAMGPEGGIGAALFGALHFSSNSARASSRVRSRPSALKVGKPPHALVELAPHTQPLLPPPSPLAENQNRLLYLCELHSDGGKKWMRKPALIVLIYEGIVANVFDFDYAPQSDLIENRRVWLNISQEGKSDIEFLREEEVRRAHCSSS